MAKHLISIEHLSAEGIKNILELTKKVKHNKSLHQELLKGRTLALVFQKPSNRTRVSFEVGIAQLGGNCIYLGPEEINLGVRESTYDVAKTLSRYVSGIVARTFSHEDIVDLARHADVPIINGLSDLDHPCQALTDLFSIKEKLGKLEGQTLAYIGDGNNVCHSLLLAASKVGLNMNIATPPGYEPDFKIIEKARGSCEKSRAHVSISNSPQEAVRGANVIYTDVWVSMGDEAEADERLKDFDKFQINEELCKIADKDFIFMHCLPAHRGQEVTEEVIDGPHSIVFDQAENRLHTQKAVLISLYS
jgi:ornithine carbamoyltransferase